MELIGLLVIGVVAGWLAGVITRTNRSIWGDLLLGLAGALLAWFLGIGLGDSLIGGIVIATIAAVILVFVKNWIMGRRAT